MSIQIPNYLSNSKSTTIEESQGNAQLAGAVSEAQASGIHGVMQAELAQFDRLKYKTEQAALMKQEADFNASLGNSLPKLFGEIGNAVSNSMIKIKEVYDSASEYDLKLQENSYLINSQIDTQKKYLDFSEKAKKLIPENGEGYTLMINDFMNNEIINSTKNAPSAAAALETFSKLSNMKLQATSQAMNFEKDQKSASVIRGVEQTAASLAFQASKNPDDYEVYKQQLEANLPILRESGIDADKAQRFIDRSKSNLFQSRIGGLVDNQRYDDAIKLLHSEEGIQTLSNEAYGSTTRSVLSAMKSAQEEQDKLLQRQLLNNQLNSGLPLPNTKEAREAMDAGFIQYIKPMMNPDGTIIEGVSQETFLQQTANYYKDKKVFDIAPSHKQLLEGSILNGKPEVAFQQSRVVSALINDPETARIAAQLDDRTRFEAMKIQQLTSFGISPEEAVKQTRELRTVDPNKIKLAKERIQDSFYQSARSKIDPKNPDATGAALVQEFGDIKNVKIAKNDYEDMALNYVLQTGDLETGVKMATNKLHLKYGISTINGEKELMQYAPEMSYNKPFLNKFKEGLEKSLTDISTKLSGTTGKSNQLAYKDKLGDVRYINISLRPIDGITENSAPHARIYGLFDKDTGLPILQSDIKPDGDPTQLTYSYDYTKSDIYLESLKEHEFNVQKDAEYRQSVAKKQEKIKQLITSTSKFVNLTQNEKFGIISLTD